MILSGRKISKGLAEGEVLKSTSPISFLGGVDPKTGVVMDKNSNVFGKSIKDKIFVFPMGKGSTVGSYVIYQLKKNGAAPLAIINKEAETIVSVGAIISDIPMIDKIEIDNIEEGKKVKVDGDKGTVELL
jgi:predicted aconitase with swiveling domain